MLLNLPQCIEQPPQHNVKSAKPEGSCPNLSKPLEPGAEGAEGAVGDPLPACPCTTPQTPVIYVPRYGCFL